MSLTDATYFATPDCMLPQGTYNTIVDHISRYERDILIQLLGYDLAKLVIAYDVSTSPQRIKDIVVGKEYTEGIYTVKWNGLQNTEKVSILSYYAYIQYIKNKAVTFQGVGAVAATSEGTVSVSPTVLMSEAGYKLRALAGYAGQDVYAASLYNFLNKYSTDYPEWIFNEFHPVNLFIG
jgi:hypothetical protein